MDKLTPIMGSIEIVTMHGQSIGVPGQRWTPAIVPVVLEALQGITGLTTVVSGPQPTGRTPEAQWTGIDADNQSVTVMLWRDVPFDETVIAQAVAAAIRETT